MNKQQWLQALPILIFLYISPLISSSQGVFKYEFLRIALLYITTTVTVIILILTTTKWYHPPKKIRQASLILMGIWIASSLIGVSWLDSFVGRYGIWIFSTLSLIIYFSYTYITFNLAKHHQNSPDLITQATLIPAIILGLNSVIQKLNTIQGFDTSKLLDPDRLELTFTNPNHLGFYFSIMFIFALSTIVHTKNPTTKLLSLAATVSALIGTILTLSRGSWIATGITLLILAIIRIKSKDNFLNLLRTSSIRYTIFGLILSLFIFSPLIVRRVQATIPKDNNRVSYQLRLKEWQTGLQIFRHYPITGIGPENTDAVYPQYRDKALNLVPEEWQWRTVVIRNLYIEILATIGIVGLAALIYLFINILKVPFPYKAGVIAFIVHGAIYQTNLITITLFCTWIALGLSTKKLKSRSLDPRLKYLYLTLAFTILTLTAIVIKSELHSNKSISLLSQEETVQAYTQSKIALILNPLFDKNLRQHLYITQLYIQNLDAKEPLRNELIEEYLADLKRLEKFNQKNVDNLKTLAGGYMRYANLTHTDHQKALDYSNQLLKLDPTSPGSWDTLGITYLDSQDYDHALETFSYILSDIMPDYPYAYFHIGETLRQMGRPEDAIEFYQTALDLGYAGAQREINETIIEVNQN